MSNKRFETKPDGTKIIVRAAYDPRVYSFSSIERERLDHIRSGYGSEDVLDEYDGELANYHEIRRFERDDKRWVLLQHPLEYAMEVELTRGREFELRLLPPEEAWALARELDQQETRYPIEVESSSVLP
jgi:hypothetical protein